jgi:hypothetical protein
VTRCQFLLQRGRFVADAAYFCGENSPAEMRVGDPPLPVGYDFDAIGADALKDARVDHHQLVLKSGMRYRVLILPPDDRNISPPLLEKIRWLVEHGLTLVGPPPEHAPGLENYPQCDNEVRGVAAVLWGDCDGKKVTSHAFGNGRVYWGATLETVFAALDTKPDFEFASSGKTKLSYIHRTDGDAEIYFVSNQRDGFDSADCTFRVSGKVPELWHADTGMMEPAPVWREENGRTLVPLQFDPSGSVFVIFRHTAPQDHPVSITQDIQVKKSGHTPELIIHRAVYGVAMHPSQSMDVTEKVRALLAKGVTAVPANNEFAGNDPAVNIVKKMRVEYSLKGQPHTEMADENQTLELPPSAQLTNPLYGYLPSTTAVGKKIHLTEKLSVLV